MTKELRLSFIITVYLLKLQDVKLIVTTPDFYDLLVCTCACILACLIPDISKQMCVDLFHVCVSSLYVCVHWHVCPLSVCSELLVCVCVSILRRYSTCHKSFMRLCHEWRGQAHMHAHARTHTRMNPHNLECKQCLSM